MTTDNDLDARLLAARGLRDADLPALPTDFLDFLHASDTVLSGIATGPGTLTASESAARTPTELPARPRGVTAAHNRTSLDRSARLRVGASILAIAAVWAIPFVVTTPDHSGAPDTRLAAPSDSTIAAPADGTIRLVAAEVVTFPLSLDPLPVGLTPAFSRVGGTPGDAASSTYFASYRTVTGDGFTLWLYPTDPRATDMYYWPENADGITVTDTGTTSVDGRDAQFVSASDSASNLTALVWERPDGRWVQILGEDGYGSVAAVVAVAEALIDSPQPVGFQYGVTPAGWSVSGYEESRSIDVVNEADPTQVLRLSVYQLPPDSTVDTMMDGEFASPIEPVTIKGQPGRIALRAGDPDFWYVVGKLADKTFLLIAPDNLSHDQVLAIAEQIRYSA